MISQPSSEPPLSADNDQLRQALIGDEGWRPRAYRDNAGTLTIGVGRNLEDGELSADEIELMLRNDLNTSMSELDRALPWWRGMSEARQAVLVNMHFNLGLSRLLQFKMALAAMQAGDWDRAAAEMRDSRWAGQVGRRAERLIQQMRTDRWVLASAS